MSVAVLVYNRAFVDHWDFHTTTAAAMAHQVGEIGAGPETGFFAYIDDRPVAMCLARVDGGIGFINVLGTDPIARGRGVAFALLRQSTVEFARRGVTLVDLDVDAANPTGAVRLYERSGMITRHLYTIFELALPRPPGATPA